MKNITHTFADQHTLESTRELTDEGFIRTDARISRVGVADYLAAEFGDYKNFGVESPESIISVYRPAATLFNDDTLKSFAGKPVTNDHTTSNVNLKNIKNHQVGHIGDSVVRDGDAIRARLTITDENAINAINEGKLGLSIGYSGSIDIENGVTDSGQKYNAILKSIRGNHVALTNNPRAGFECRLLDQNKTKKRGTMRKLKMNGIDVELNDQAHQAVSIMNDKYATLQDESTVIKKENETLLGKIDSLKLQINDAESVEKLVSQRVALIDSVREIVGSDVNLACKSAREINVAVIKTTELDFVDAERSDEYIAGRAEGIINANKKNKSADRFGINAINDARNQFTKPEISYTQRVKNEAIKKQREMNNKSGAK